MQKLQNSQGVQRLSAFLPIVPGVRCAAYSTAWPASHSSIGVRQQAQGSAGCVGQLGPQRGANSGAGQRSDVHWSIASTYSDWPGRGHGVRAPSLGEVPLSWQEVVHGINHGLIG
jgi:hypothetical protein